MAPLRALLALAAPAVAGAAMLHQASQYGGPNPIRKVVNLLSAMQQKVTEEGSKEEELHHKFMCYCQTSKENLATSMEQGKSQIANQGTAEEEAVNSKSQVEADLKAHKASREEAKDTIAKATALREKEGKAYAADAAQSTSNLQALSNAIAAIERGSAGSFMQTADGGLFRRYTMEQADISDSSRQQLLSFLSGSSDAYTPSSGEALGILKQMRDTMQNGAIEAEASEQASQKSFLELMAAKKKEVDSLQEQIESEQMRLGEISVLIASSGHDLEAVKGTLVENEKLLADLEATCATKTKEWQEITKARGEELVALAETIKVLNDDENLDLFKQTLPSFAQSFLQIQVSSAALKARALATIRAAAVHIKIAHPQLNLIALALSGKKIGFEQVVKMIDNLVNNLQREQKDDDDKKSYCAAQFDASEDTEKELELAASNSEAAIDEIDGNIEKLREEIKELQDGIKALDASVGEATKQRQAEHADHVEMVSNNQAAKDVLAWAKNRLNKFYNPKLYKEAFTQLSSSDLVFATEPPPEAPGPYTKSEETAGVIHMIDGLVADLDKEIQTGEVSEKHAQKDYEKLLGQARAKRAEDSGALTEKESSVAALEEGLQAEQDKKSGSEKELAAIKNYIGNLHNECDWLLQYYDQRKEARDGEIEALGKGKAVLSGADFSLLQVGQRSRTRRPAAFLAP